MPATSLVVPVKGGLRAKSRLHTPDRPELADAVARDCVTAALAVPEVHLVVVTADPHVARWARALGAQIHPDPGGGLNPAIRAGLTALPPASLYAVLLGDLPCLTPEDLASALSRCAEYERAVVPDADGGGTVLLTRCEDVPAPAFGAGSAARHERAGHRRLELALPRLRTDVDDVASLARALSLGVGHHTAEVVARRARGAPAPAADAQSSTV